MHLFKKKLPSVGEDFSLQKNDVVKYPNYRGTELCFSTLKTNQNATQPPLYLERKNRQLNEDPSFLLTCSEGDAVKFLFSHPPDNYRNLQKAAAGIVDLF